MIPISLRWDSQKRSVLLRWNGFFCAGWQDGKLSMKILGCPLPRFLRRKRIRSPRKLRLRWTDLREVLSLLPNWKLKKMEGTLSFPDPMVNGVLYGWMSANQALSANRKNRMTVSFLGENWCRGEITLSLRVFLKYLGSRVLLRIHQRRGRKAHKGGKS